MYCDALEEGKPWQWGSRSRSTATRARVSNLGTGPLPSPSALVEKTRKISCFGARGRDPTSILRAYLGKNPLIFGHYNFNIKEASRANFTRLICAHLGLKMCPSHLVLPPPPPKVIFVFFLWPGEKFWSRSAQNFSLKLVYLIFLINSEFIDDIAMQVLITSVA